jgi:hypothetical protein
MQAIPSRTPLSRTAFCTSSVMSVTVRPPAVRKRVSCWNTFIVAAILRESLPDAAGEPPHPQWILQDAEGRPGHLSSAEKKESRRRRHRHMPGASIDVLELVAMPGMEQAARHSPARARGASPCRCGSRRRFRLRRRRSDAPEAHPLRLRRWEPPRVQRLDQGERQGHDHPRKSGRSPQDPGEAGAAARPRDPERKPREDPYLRGNLAGLRRNTSVSAAARSGCVGRASLASSASGTTSCGLSAESRGSRVYFGSRRVPARAAVWSAADEVVRSPRGGGLSAPREDSVRTIIDRSRPGRCGALSMGPPGFEPGTNGL